MKCPKCGSEQTQYVTNTTNGGPSFSKGCCGWILLGPVGLLCSFCGNHSETDEYWICNSCGSKFQAGDYESELENKTNRVKKLKQEILDLENSLKNKPDDLEDKLKNASEEYNAAKEKHKQFEKDFFSTSGVLKILNTLYYVLPAVAILITIIGFLGILSVGEIIVSIIWVILGAVVTWALIVIIDSIQKKAQKNVDSEKAEKLEKLWNDCQNKEKHYKELKKIKDNITSHEKKIIELDTAEQELEIYRKNEESKHE